MKKLKLNIVMLIVVLIISQLLFPNPVVEHSETYLKELESKDKTLHIISSMNGAAFSENSKTSSIDDEIKMSVVFMRRSDNLMINHSAVKKLIIDRLNIPEILIKPIETLGNVSIKWYKVEEANGGTYDNTKPEWHWDDIPYKETEIIEWRDKFIVSADVTPTVFDPVFCNDKVVGTMRYKAVLTISGEAYSTPGKDSKFKGSIGNDVHRISLKGNTNNEVINYALAMCNLPYIWGSESFTGSKWDKHQAELFIGADCADFAVAAHQMADKQLPYDSIKYLSHTKVIVEQHSTDNGNYLNDDNRKISVGTNGVQVGDFIYWGTVHVGLFYEDRSNPNGRFSGKADGIFNEWDLVLHTLYAEPKIESIDEIPNYGNLTVYRFKKKE